MSKNIFKKNCLFLLLFHSMKLYSCLYFTSSSIVFDHWSEASNHHCNNFKIQYNKDFSLAADETIKVHVHNTFNETFSCRNINSTTGICHAKPLIDNSKNITLTFFLESNLTVTLLQTKIFQFSFIEARGPLELNVKTIGSDFAVIQWYRPWKSFCSFSIEALYENCVATADVKCDHNTYFQKREREICMDISNSDGRVMCERTISKLTEQTSYSYRLKYAVDSYKLSQDTREKWSAWSHVLNLTTLSSVPQESPRVSCVFTDDKTVEVSWRVSASLTNISSLYFVLQDGFTVYNISKQVDFNALYRRTFPLTQNKYISLSTCSNSGCLSIQTKSTCKVGYEQTSNKLHIILPLLILLCIGVILVMIWAVHKMKLRKKKHVVSTIVPREGGNENLQATLSGVQLNSEPHIYDRPHIYERVPAGVT